MKRLEKRVDWDWSSWGDKKTRNWNNRKK